MKASPYLGAAIALVLLSACGEPDIILPGQREDIRPVDAAANEARPISIGNAVANADWTQRNGGPEHRIAQPALAPALAQVFSVAIGEGDSRRARITADPVVAGGIIYTLDARSRVTATATSGAPVWAVDVAPSNDGRADASGGGLAVAGGRVFVTTGFGELTALDAGSGGVLWTQDLDAPGGSAPTVVGDLVYLVSRNSVGWAIEADSGRIRWQVDGTPSVGNFSGGAGVAVSDQMAVFPFPSGEVLAAFREGGLRRWSSVVTGERLGAAAASISDIAGDPVIDGNTVYVGNFSGRVVAMSLTDGERLWTAAEGAVGPVWPAGGSLFFVNDVNELIRLDAADGSTIWRVALPTFTETRLRQQRTVFAHYGPILAGGRLIVASSDGVIRAFDPTSGTLVATTAIAGGAASNPVVAGGTLYVVSKDGQLVAFR